MSDFIRIDRYAELYERLGKKTELLSGILWVEYSRMVTPVGPVRFDYRISKEECELLLSAFPKALLVRLTYNFNTPIETEWYAVICDRFLELEEFRSENTRSKIRRGLKNCSVERVDAEFLCSEGYEVYAEAFKRYESVKPVDEKIFKEAILVTKSFDDIVHYWGVFEKSSKKLVAYSQNYIYGNIEANYSTIKFHPAYLKLYPSYALFYKMNEYYLRYSNFEYVNDGYRNLLHATGVQSFLIDQFNFRKAFANISVTYRSWVSLLLSTTFRLRKLIGRLDAKLGALYKLEEIRRLSKSQKIS